VFHIQSEIGSIKSLTTDCQIKLDYYKLTLSQQVSKVYGQSQNITLNFQGVYAARIEAFP